MTLEQMWDALEEMSVSEQTLQIVTNINGYNEQTIANAHRYTNFASEDAFDECEKVQIHYID